MHHINRNRHYVQIVNFGLLVAGVRSYYEILFSVIHKHARSCVPIEFQQFSVYYTIYINMMGLLSRFTRYVKFEFVKLILNENTYVNSYVCGFNLHNSIFCFN